MIFLSPFCSSRVLLWRGPVSCGWKWRLCGGQSVEDRNRFVQNGDCDSPFSEGGACFCWRQVSDQILVLNILKIIKCITNPHKSLFCVSSTKSCFFPLSVLFAAGIDYVGISHNLDFAPGVSMQTFKVTILDDMGQPELEGAESFELVLQMPVNGILGEPGKATVFINDSQSDCK